MGCQHSKHEDVVVASPDVEAPKRRKSLTQRMAPPARSSESANRRPDVFSIFAEHGMPIDRNSGQFQPSCSPSSVSMSLYSNATTASDNDRSPISAPPQQRIADLSVVYGSCSAKGLRESNEDRSTSTYQRIGGENIAYFGVYDGHNGPQVAEHLSQNLHTKVFEQLGDSSDLEKGISNAYAATDSEILDCKMTSGSTAVSLVLRQNQAVVASVGDSRAVLSSAGRARDISQPHTPEVNSEKERILAANGKVSDGRIFGLLGVSRAFGDNDFKTSRGEFKDKFNGDLVSAEPDIVHLTIADQDEFIVLASDGLFDVMSSQRVVDFIRSKLELHGDIQHACEELVSQAVNLGSMDNVTATVVCFHQATITSPIHAR